MRFAEATRIYPAQTRPPGQLFAGALARAKGLDADRPLGLTKVTLAK